MTELYPEYPVLFVDDEEKVLQAYKLSLLYNGINHFHLCSKASEVMNLLKTASFSMVFLDLIMPEISGNELLPQIKQQYPHLPVIVLTGSTDLDAAVQCMKDGAMDYIVKPVDNNRLIASLKLALKIGNLDREIKDLKTSILEGKIKNPDLFSFIITKNKKMFSIFQYIEAISRSLEPVLITGESGVGKELIAKALHLCCDYKGEMVSLNLAGLDDTVFSDTLFGHRKGAYTGASENRKGLVEKATGGTLFLDEIGDLKPESQVKLLRLIQEKEYYSLGSDNPKIANTRIIAATNRDLNSMCKKGEFRQDLYYRLSTHSINIPPLRERPEDITLLIDYFINQCSQKLGKEFPSVSPDVYKYLKNYHFPGNIRELRSLVFDALIQNQNNLLQLEPFLTKIKNETMETDLQSTDTFHQGSSMFDTMDPLPTLKEANFQLIESALERTGGVQSQAARILGISAQALSKRLKTISTVDREM